MLFDRVSSIHESVVEVIYIPSRANSIQIILAYSEPKMESAFEIRKISQFHASHP